MNTIVEVIIDTLENGRIKESKFEVSPQCEKCGEVLLGDFTGRCALLPEDKKLLIEPCENCLTNESGKAYGEGSSDERLQILGDRHETTASARKRLAAILEALQEEGILETYNHSNLDPKGQHIADRHIAIIVDSIVEALKESED